MTGFTRALRRHPATARRTAATARRTAASAGLVAAGALLLAACGGDGTGGMRHGAGGSTPTTASEAAEAAAGEGFNDTDVTFAQQMIPHHEQALEMARLADGRASDPEIKDLAGRIEQAQDPEIRTMKGWLESWKQPAAARSGSDMEHGGHGSGHGSDDGMMSAADMEQLKGMKGTAFDKAFAEMMIEHHNGAISMARDEQRNGENPGARKMAGDIVDGQSAEVEQLRDILDRL
ncbi:DUF305 domain-containing protein [Streptomyces sp. JB150]|uniref:DUF305 domain-containing protein n=1 Tax=Streptomyces sp. JB150 TaxID=2714844 RepID=UPI001409490E|nr:DUF305 domain-containing protein [Streptomyces sp. JB150]QIJ66232.1 DUF305 domain-containing protein [Streptomyces sp. JB150]